MSSEICRICEKSDDLFEIFGKESDVAEKIQALANVTVEPTDTLPKTICSECLTILETAYNFKILCETTDAKLRYDFQADIELVIIEETNDVSIPIIDSKEDIIKIEPELMSPEFEVIENIKEEETEENPRFKHNCVTCQASFKTAYLYREHIKIHGNERIQCESCEKWFRSQYHLNKHLESFEGRAHTKKITYHCNYPGCTKEFTGKQNMTRHVKILHDKVKDYICEICNKNFARKATLIEHMSSHSTGKNLECTICRKKFKSPTNLKRHLRMHDDDPKEREKMKRYVQKRAEKRQPIVCTVCGIILSSHQTAANHMQTHSDDRPYSCTFCHKKFKYANTCKTHMNIHEGIRPYKCGLCPRTFRQWQHRKQHRFTHTNEKPFVCHICNKPFRMKGNLTVHMNIHTGETPHHCDKCERKFGDRGALRKHLKTHENKDKN